uniref:Uncharacterized protein TCIL3000_6_20 n=1 Tax=Trypanosoma congolense (strain IL3000) TaxID=1068625 RepID=G0UN16_TRYCI|nr:unnamed protein product [Trypanosoma congolense IL3000]
MEGCGRPFTTERCRTSLSLRPGGSLAPSGVKPAPCRPCALPRSSSGRSSQRALTPLRNGPIVPPYARSLTSLHVVPAGRSPLLLRYPIATALLAGFSNSVFLQHTSCRAARNAVTVAMVGILELPGSTMFHTDSPRVTASHTPFLTAATTAARGRSLPVPSTTSIHPNATPLVQTKLFPLSSTVVTIVTRCMAKMITNASFTSMVHLW